MFLVEGIRSGTMSHQSIEQVETGLSEIYFKSIVAAKTIYGFWLFHLKKHNQSKNARRCFGVLSESSLALRDDC